VSPASPVPQQDTQTGLATSDQRRLFGVVGMLSLAHEVPSALAGIMVPTLFVKTLGLDVKYLGLFAIPVLVAAFKWLWAPVVDRWGSARFGRRVSWIVPSTLVVSLLYAAMAAVSPSLATLPVVIGLLCLVAISFSLYEIASDAYILENLPKGETGRGSAVIWFGKEIGQIIGLAGLLTIADTFGWTPAFLTAAGAFALLNAVLLVRRERALDVPEPVAKPSFIRTLRVPFNRRLLLLVLGFAFAVQMPVAVIGPFLSSRGLTLSQVGATIGIAASAGAAISLSLAGIAIRRIGIKAMAGAMIVVGLSAAPAFLWLAATPEPALPLVLAAIFWGALCTAPIRMTFYAARLGWTPRRQAATDFTVQQSVWFLGHGLALAIGGVLASAVGWFWFFVITSVLSVAALASFVLLHDRFDAEARLAEAL
jgi:MFS family permease